MGAREINPNDEELLQEAMTGQLTEETVQQAGARAQQEQDAAAQYQEPPKPQKLSEANLDRHNNNTKKAKKSKKPKWALTEQENEDVEELEVDDLLDFAENLDYEQYIDDMEVKEAL